MSASLPRKLRRAAKLWNEIDEEGEFTALRKLCLEAADEIARLRRELNKRGIDATTPFKAARLQAAERKRG